MHFRYSEWNHKLSKKQGATPFDTLFDIFQQLLIISSGDVSQALKWLTELDNEYGITKDFEDYSLGNFIDELKNRGYIEKDDQEKCICSYEESRTQLTSEVSGRDIQKPRKRRSGIT